MIGDLARSLIDAAAEALCVDHGHSRQDGGMNCRTCARRARTSVVAVLETLAARGQSSDLDIPPQVRLAVPAMQRLAAEIREGR